VKDHYKKEDDINISKKGRNFQQKKNFFFSMNFFIILVQKTIFCFSLFFYISNLALLYTSKKNKINKIKISNL
jgi:hypothetical protein